MCGILAVVRRPSTRTPPTPGQLQAALDLADGAMALGRDGLLATAGHLESVDRALRGVPGVLALARNDELTADIEGRLDSIEADAAAFEQALDAGELPVAATDVEAVNAALIRLKDAIWAVRRDRLRTATAVAALASGAGGGHGRGRAAIEAFTSVQLALAGIDRLEVRGRDSAGIHLLVTGHELDLDDADVRSLLADRAGDPLFTSMAVETPDGHLSFVYKAAAEIGELGGNV